MSSQRKKEEAGPRAWMLVWNPKEFNWERRGFRQSLAEIYRLGYLDSTWSCGWTHSKGPHGPRAGGRFFALRVGSDRPGLIGAGRFLSRPNPRRTWRGMPLARVRFEYLADYRSKAFLTRPPLQLLTGDDLRYQASGMPIRPLIAARLELLLGLIHSGRPDAET